MRPITLPVSLVAFTALSTLASGSWIIAGFLNVVGVFPSVGAMGSLGVLAACVAVLTVAFLFSTLHLARPLRCFSAFNRAGGSNLSNEVLTGFLFVVFAVAYLAVCACNALDAGVEAVLAALSVLMAVLFLLVSSRAYCMPTVPAWNAMSFSLGFVADAALGGCVFVVCAGGFFGGYGQDLQRVLAAGALLAFAASAILAMFQARHAFAQVNAWVDVAWKSRAWVRAQAARLTLQGVGATLLCVCVALGWPFFAWACAALLTALGVAAERCSFYLAYDCVGLPR